MTNNNSNSQSENINTMTFTSTTANPNDLKPHQMLIEMGYGHTPDPYFIESLKYFNQYDKPVIDKENNVVTHLADVLAAKENGMVSLEVYQMQMTSSQLRRFIALKHKYHSRNLIASFNTIKFYEDYLANDEEGIKLSDSMTGTTREKIAMLMQTSDSTIKRIKEVGTLKADKLGLIEQGYTSFKQVTDEIKAERLAARTVERKAAMTAAEPTPVNEYYVEPNANPIENAEPVAQGEYYVADPAGNESDVVPGGLADEPYYDGGETNEVLVHPTQPKFEDFNCMFSSAGLGQFEISVSDNVPTVTINGEELKNISYEVHVDEKNSNGTAHSFILSQPGKNALCIQLTVENLSKAA